MDAATFVRTLITVLQTMENLPDVRYVSMRLHYNHTCPDDYEPECFRHVNSHDVKYFTEEPTRYSFSLTFFVKALTSLMS